MLKFGQGCGFNTPALQEQSQVLLMTMSGQDEF